MKVDAEIEHLREKILTLSERIGWLMAHRDKLEALPEGRFCNDTLDFDNLPHAEVIKVVRTLGGKWAKTPATVDRVDYQTQIGSIAVRCWRGEPPPSCRIVEVEEVVPEQIIPATIRKVKKMICTDHKEPVTVALARAQTTNNNSVNERTVTP